LDGNGQTSAWVQFGTGTSPDFTVNPAALVSALFDWSPTIAVGGSPVQFTAQAASQSGLSFAWDFGGGVTASVASVSKTFAAAGPVNVTLTVTDTNGHQATATETVQVASAQLQDTINTLARVTSNLLNQLSSEAQQAADAADYFQKDTGDTETQVAISTAFTLLGLGISAGEFEGWIQTSLGQDAIGAGIEELEQWAANWVGQQIVPGLPSYSNLCMPNIQAFIARKQNEIEQLIPFLYNTR
jgi:PKD repeat protein